MKITSKRFLFVVPILLAVGCSGGNNETGKKTGQDRSVGDHVWKGQVEALEKAKQVEGMLKKSLEDKNRIIEQQTR